jgi:hypothetical protein
MSPLFEYLHFYCDRDELQERLSAYGQEGWRLHTCDPVVTVGEYGTGIIYAFVVMDKAYMPEEEPGGEEEPEPEAMAAKG